MENSPDIRGYLKKIYIFQDLDPDEIAGIADIMTAVEFEAGETIMREGETGHSMYVISSGEVVVTKTLTMKFGQDDFRETDKTLTILKAEDYQVFGEMALVTEMERSATVAARTDCRLYEINRDRFLALAGEKRSLGFRVMMRLTEMVCTRLKKSDEDIIRLTTALSIALSQ